MGTTAAVLGTVFLLQFASLTLGTPSYREVITNYPNNYLYNLDRSYYTNPYTNYRYTYKNSNPYSGRVYVTDKYGQTTLAGTSATHQSIRQYLGSRGLFKSKFHNH